MENVSIPWICLGWYSLYGNYAGQCSNGFSILSKNIDSFLQQNVETGPGVHPESYSLDSKSHFQEE